MIAIVDTDVLLDVVLARSDFLADSAAVVDKAVRSEYSGFVCATTVTNIYYVARKSLGKEKTQKALSTLLGVFAVAPVNRSIIQEALDSDFTDLEDAILYFSGKAMGTQCVVTRNISDYSKAELTVYDPAQFLVALG